MSSKLRAIGLFVGPMPGPIWLMIMRANGHTPYTAAEMKPHTRSD